MGVVMNPWDNWRPEIDGWSSDILPWYEAISEELQDGAVVAEVGVYCGRSCLYLAEAFARRGKTDCRIYAVDTFEAGWRPNMWDEFKEHLRRTPTDARELVLSCKGVSAVVAQGIENASLDLLFIDADHNYESVRNDIAAWRSKVKPGGIISGHDYSGDMYGSFPGVDQAVHEAFGRENVLTPSGSVWRIK